VGSLWHPWFTTTNLSYRFPIFNFRHRLMRYYWFLYLYQPSWSFYLRDLARSRLRSFGDLHPRAEQWNTRGVRCTSPLDRARIAPGWSPPASPTNMGWYDDHLTMGYTKCLFMFQLVFQMGDSSARNGKFSSALNWFYYINYSQFYVESDTWGSIPFWSCCYLNMACVGSHVC
jgi:hypothetical protein